VLVARDKAGVNQKRFYKQLIAKADALFDAHLTALKAKRKRKGQSNGQVIRRTRQTDDHEKDPSKSSAPRLGTHCGIAPERGQ
jgi:hypothetical protein